MVTNFAPMGQQTVRFAKQYRRQEVRTAARSPLDVGRVRHVLTASLGRVLRTRPARTEPQPYFPARSHPGDMSSEGSVTRPAL